MTLRIATRGSRLARWQAERVGSLLGGDVRIVTVETAGDVDQRSALHAIGGQGVFVKEVQQAVLDGRADVAVHSAKDLPSATPDGLVLAAVPERADPRDALVWPHGTDLAALPPGARVGTSSLRRTCQLRARYPQLEILPLRGNVNTRLKRLDEGRFEAIVLAAAGLQRLGFEDRIAAYLDPEVSLPAVGQGAIGIECRREDMRTNALIAPLDHRPTRLCVAAERAFNAHLEGGCQVPIGAYAEWREGMLHLRGMVGEPDGSRLLRAEMDGPAEEAETLGQALAEALLAQGARRILDKVYGRV